MECKGILGYIFGHNYQARYSISAPMPFTFNSIFANEIVEVMEASKSKTYECDICVRCGHVIKDN